MEFRILGSFEVVGSAGLVDLRGAKRRSLLACLVVHAGQPMSTDLNRSASEPLDLAVLSVALRVVGHRAES